MNKLVHSELVKALAILGHTYECIFVYQRQSNEDPFIRGMMYKLAHDNGLPLRLVAKLFNKSLGTVTSAERSATERIKLSTMHATAWEQIKHFIIVW